MLRFAFLFAALFVATTPVFAEQYISLAQERTDKEKKAWGLATRPTEKEAVAAAIGYCQENASDCEATITQKGGCAAVAWNSDKSHVGIGIKPTQAEAEEEAMAGCVADGKYSGCALTDSGCAN